MSKYIPASKYCKKVFDGTHDSPKPVINGFPLITSKNILGGILNLSNSYNISESNYYAIQKRSKVSQWDILFSMIGSVGEIYLEKKSSIPYAIKNVGVFSCEDEYEAKWLYYYFKSPQSKQFIQNYLNGAVQKFLPLGTLRNFPVLPYNDKYKFSIDLLSAIDSKIELNNRINAELEAMAKTLYDYWFVQFDFPDKNGKPYKTIGGKMVWNEELKREIPEGWEVKSIDYYANVIDPHPSHRAPLEVIDGYPFAGIGDIDEFGNIDINKARVIDEEFVLKQERDYTINDYSIGYGRVGTVGKVVKLRKQPFRFALSPTMAIINPKNNSLPSFVYFTVNNPTFLQWVNKYTSGSTRPAIGIQHLRTIPVIKPIVYSENLLEKFEKAVESSFKQTDILNKENQKLTELRDWLLPMLMNGQVKVN